MPARIKKSSLPEEGFGHREHISKRGRTKGYRFKRNSRILKNNKLDKIRNRDLKDYELRMSIERQNW